MDYQYLKNIEGNRKYMSSNGVKGDIPLNLISDADLKREADKIRQAKKLQAEASKLGPIGTPLPPGGEALPKGQDKGQTRKGAVTANRTENAFQEQVRKAKEEAAKAKKVEKELEKKLKLLEKKQKEFETKIKILIDSGGEILQNPEAAIQNNILALAQKFGPAGIAITLVPQIVDALLAEFEDGGIFDTRVKEIQQVGSMAAVKYLADIEAGVVLFNQSGYLTDEPPGINNTEKLVAGQQRYFLLNTGGYVGFTN